MPQPAASENMPLASAAVSGWAIVNSPNTSATQSNLLSGVTCVSASDCWAVGYYYNGITNQTLIERWDGTSWAIVTSPNTSAAQDNVVSGVTCVSASDCWAVGYYDLGSAFYQTLIERWDGTSWVIVSSPNTLAASGNLLAAVTCASASECWAVGFYFNGVTQLYQTLIERWDGTSWAIVTSPNKSATQTNVLSDVTCVSASNCWAVGYTYNSAIFLETLIERWDGTSWAIVTSPNTSATQDNVFWGVTCESASDCWAVGYYYASASQTLIERWDGTSWAIVTSPNTSAAQDNVLFGVTCALASNCWAAGYYFNGSTSTYQTLIERWDGTSWAIASSPNTSATQHNFLYGVTCESASDCWAVRYYINAGTWQTLIEHYTATPPTPTSAVSRKTHGTAGIFDVNLPITGTPGIECRTGGSNNDYQIIVTFSSAVTFNNAAVTSGTGTVSNTSGNDTTEVTLNLTGVSNAQTIAITLFGVSDGTNTRDVVVPMGVLIGDTSANRLVNSTDVSQTQSQSGQAVTGSNFRTDVNVNGLIDSTDVSTVQSKSGTGLP